MSDVNKVCQNCGSRLNGEYCSTCGQRDVELKVPLDGLIKELVEELLSFDSRLFHSLRPFLWKPGALTVEYVSGKHSLCFDIITLEARHSCQRIDSKLSAKRNRMHY